MKTRKVGIIGLGHVGAHVAYSLAVQGIADELVLVTGAGEESYVRKRMSGFARQRGISAPQGNGKHRNL